MEKAKWTTTIMAEALMTTTGRLSRWMARYGIIARVRIKGSNYKDVRLFTDEQFISVMRIHLLSSMGYSAQGIRNILEQKNNVMKIDRLKHPILSYGDMDAFVNQLTDLEMEELVKAMEHLVVNKQILIQLQSKLNELEKKNDESHELAKKNYKDSVELMTQIEEIKERIRPLI